VVSGDGWLVVQYEVVLFEPVGNRVAGVGCTDGLWKGPLPPWMMCIHISHDKTVGGWLESWKDSGQWFRSTWGVEIEESELFLFLWLWYGDRDSQE
jgi:hypothetical protein